MNIKKDDCQKEFYSGDGTRERGEDDTIVNLYTLMKSDTRNTENERGHIKSRKREKQNVRPIKKTKQKVK